MQDVASQHRLHDKALEGANKQRDGRSAVQGASDLALGLALGQPLLQACTVVSQQRLHHALFVEHSAGCLLAEENGRAVGYALYFFNFSTFVGTKGLYLEDLFLLPEMRKKGYGKQLMQALFNLAAAQQCGRMEWCCLNWNTPSQEFYTALGAKPMTEWTTWRLTKDDIARLARA